MKGSISNFTTKRLLGFIFLISVVSCSSIDKVEQTTQAYNLLDQAYKEFRAGNNNECISLSNEALTMGKEIENDTLIGDALTGLCRATLRDKNEQRLKQLSQELSDLSKRTNDETWLMIGAHMNAEMARMNGDLDKAEKLYDESMRISKQIGSLGMYSAEHFNKSFIAVSKNDFEMARSLILQYYEIRREMHPEEEDAYGLLALVNLLVANKDLLGAAEVSIVIRKLFSDQNIVPDPADEMPLREAEEIINKELSQTQRDSIAKNVKDYSANNLLNKYLK